MAIVAIGITVVIEVFAGGLRLAGKSQEYSRAAFYGRQLLEEVCLQQEITEGSEQGVLKGIFPGNTISDHTKYCLRKVMIREILP